MAGDGVAETAFFVLGQSIVDLAQQQATIIGTDLFTIEVGDLAVTTSWRGWNFNSIRTHCAVMAECLLYYSMNGFSYFHNKYFTFFMPIGERCGLDSNGMHPSENDWEPLSNPKSDADERRYAEQPAAANEEDVTRSSGQYWSPTAWNGTSPAKSDMPEISIKPFHGDTPVSD